jgi:hypothetical protein
LSAVICVRPALGSGDQQKQSIRGCVGWVDERVVFGEAGIVTRRNPDDLRAFVGKIADEMKQHGHYNRKQRAAE